MPNQVDLSSFKNTFYKKGASYFKIALWTLVYSLIFKNHLIPFSFFKVFFLRLFGAKIGKNVIIKPAVKIKYPWKLIVGNNCWIGENVWIDNLETVTIQDNVCISQGAFLFCGNHDFKSTSFNLMVDTINIESGAWIGAKSIVCPGITIFSHAILMAGSFANKDLEPYTIYKGNPAKKYKERIII
ncbi:MAG: colanic acid biosynthesis acetyltransferase WcaF [Flavobacteriales bacterium]|nr:colanic acid biosynthesis acetyltransferase WcaF [Flavobacteriales bacterium]